jgi:RNA polymerase sigma-70 factor, ECF subfamily
MSTILPFIDRRFLVLFRLLCQTRLFNATIQMDSVEQMFKQHYAFVCKVIYAYVRDRTRTEDIAQDIFTELWVKRDQLQIHTSVPAYLRRMAISRTLNYIRDTRKHTWEELDIAADHDSAFEANDPGVISKLEEAELRQRLDVAIEALPEKCRLVFLLNRQEEMSYAEVARELGISVKTVENQIGKALKLLRQGIAGHRG